MTNDTTAQNVTLGQMVTYTDSKGHQKVALVIGTPESITEGSSLPVPAEGQAHLNVFGFRGQYVKISVPSAALVEQAKAQGNDDFSDGGFFTV